MVGIKSADQSSAPEVAIITVNEISRVFYKGGEDAALAEENRHDKALEKQTAAYDKYLKERAKLQD